MGEAVQQMGADMRCMAPYSPQHAGTLPADGNTALLGVFAWQKAAKPK